MQKEKLSCYLQFHCQKLDHCLLLTDILGDALRFRHEYKVLHMGW